MEQIKNWALLLIFIAVSCFIYYYLLPSGNISSTAKSVISVIVLCAVILPVLTCGKDLDMSFADEKAYGLPDENTYLDYYINSVKQKTGEVIDGIVKKYTDMPYELEIDINISGENSINIEQVRLYFDDKVSDMGNIKRDIRIETGIETQILAGKTNE